MPLISNHQFEYNSANWFVVPLFCIQVFNVVLRKLIHKMHVNEWILFIVALAIGLSGICLVKYYDYGHTIGWTLFLVRFMCYLPFFELGVLYKNRIENKISINNLCYFSCIFFIQLLIFSIYKKQPVFGFGGIASQFDESIMLFYLEGALGVFFWLRIADILQPILLDSRIIEIISRNTYSIMVNQYLGFMLVKTAFAIVSKYTSLFAGFDVSEFKSNLYYYYMPMKQWAIIYVIAGIMIPILMQLCIDKVKSNARQLLKTGSI